MKEIGAKKMQQNNLSLFIHINLLGICVCKFGILVAFIDYGSKSFLKKWTQIN
jgi:hypothetical protein